MAEALDGVAQGILGRPVTDPVVALRTSGYGTRVKEDASQLQEEAVTKAREMLDTYPRSFNIDAEVLARTIEAMTECANTCTQCADACLSEDHVEAMAKCIRLNLDCADVCLAASRVLSRQTEYDANVTRAVVEACAAVCKSCGDECQSHGEAMAHCAICAESCRRCEQACQELLSAIA